MEIEKITKLETPCGVITVSDASGSLVPFSLKPNPYQVPYEIDKDNQPTIVLAPEQNLLICISPSDIEKNKEYFIILEGTSLDFGGSDERSVCVTGSSNGYSIGLGHTFTMKKKEITKHTYSRRKWDIMIKVLFKNPHNLMKALLNGMTQKCSKTNKDLFFIG